jgi:hypothetical protein
MWRKSTNQGTNKPVYILPKWINEHNTNHRTTVMKPVYVNEKTSLARKPSKHVKLKYKAGIRLESARYRVCLKRATTVGHDG